MGDEIGGNLKPPPPPEGGTLDPVIFKTICRYMKTIFAFLFTLGKKIGKMVESNQEDKKLETAVSFEDLLTHKIKKYKTDKDGKATCMISTASNYRITIKESNDSYEYNIPDFAISPVILNFKFTIK